MVVVNLVLGLDVRRVAGRVFGEGDVANVVDIGISSTNFLKIKLTN